MPSYRGAGGLGDAVYLYPVLKHVLTHGGAAEVLTVYADIYTPLRKLGLVISDRYAKNPDINCRYGDRYHSKTTTTYQDTLTLAGLDLSIPLELEYEREEPPRLKGVNGRKVCLVRSPAYPMKGREDTRILIPDLKKTQYIIDAYRDEVFFVQVGNRNGYEGILQGLGQDLSGALTIRQLLTLVDMSDMVLTLPSFLLPFSEALSKKCFVLFSGMAMRTPRKFYHLITPSKIINKKNIVHHAIDTEPADKIVHKFGRLLGAGASRQAVAA
jgi:hypothetical protein